MPQESPGRNDPCPCGSGKKYKKCCLGQKPVVRENSLSSKTTPEGPDFGYEEDVDPLSNSAVDAIQEKRFNEAEKLCEQLLRGFPTLMDGHDRFGMLREAQGRFREAADHYAKALEIVLQHPDDYDPEWKATFKRRRDQALAKADAPK